MSLQVNHLASREERVGSVALSKENPRGNFPFTDLGDCQRRIAASQASNDWSNFLTRKAMSK